MALATSQNAPTAGGHLEILARVAHREAVLAREAAGARVRGDRRRLGQLAREQVVEAHLRRAVQRRRAVMGLAVVDEPQVAVAVLGEQRLGLGDVDSPRSAWETSRPRSYGVWGSRRPA